LPPEIGDFVLSPCTCVLIPFQSASGRTPPP
jgi:hypothetical protein